MRKYRKMYEYNRNLQESGFQIDRKTMENSYLLWIPEQKFRSLCFSSVKYQSETNIEMDMFTSKFIQHSDYVLNQKLTLVRQPDITVPHIVFVDLFHKNHKNYPRLYEVVRKILKSVYRHVGSLI